MCHHFSAEPILADSESHAVLVLVVVLVSVMVIAGIMAFIAWRKWKKEKRRAIELERAKEAITQQWIKKVSHYRCLKKFVREIIIIYPVNTAATWKNYVLKVMYCTFLGYCGTSEFRCFTRAVTRPYH